jgi:hypothetical protein
MYDYTIRDGEGNKLKWPHQPVFSGRGLTRFNRERIYDAEIEIADLYAVVFG